MPKGKPPPPSVKGGSNPIPLLTLIFTALGALAGVVVAFQGCA